MELLLLVAVLAPILGGGALFLGPCNTRRSRDTYVLALCSAVSVLVLCLVAARLSGGAAGTLLLLQVSGTDMVLALHIDGLSVVFAAILAVLWPLTDLYAFEYMSYEHGGNRFFAFFTMTYGVVLGIAFAENLFTLYFFYELLTLCTLPLVLHEMDGRARYAGKKYLLYSMSGAALAFISMMFVNRYGSLGFAPGGSLYAGAKPTALLLLAFLLGFFGFGVKAAVFPFCGWLPSAAVAPTPVSALLHAVAVVNAGLFAVIRLLYYSYGAELIAGTWAQQVCIGAATVTIVYGSSMALRHRHLKRRLAYSTVSNLSYILLGASMCSPAGLAAALTHMVAHSTLKIALFFCAGALLCQTRSLPGGPREYIDEYAGYGQKMPVVFTVFALASFGLIGVPPFAGFWGKFAAASAAVATGLPIALVGCFALVLSACLTGLYQMEVIIWAFFPHEGYDNSEAQLAKDPGPAMKISLIAMAVLSLAVVVAVPVLSAFYARIAAGLL